MSPGSLAPSVALPTRRDEAWRYAPHRTLAELTFAPPSADVVLPAGVLDSLPALDGPLVVVVNGVVDHAHSRLIGGDGGVTVTTAASADAESATPGAVAGHDGARTPSDAFLWLNAEHAHDGAVIDIAPGAQAHAPIHVIDVAVPGHTGHSGHTACARTVIRLGAGSTASVVETRVGVGTDLGGSNVRTMVTLADGATLDYVVVQDLPAAQVHLSRVDAELAAGATLRSRSFNLGATYGRLEFHVALNGPQAHADLAGLYFGAGQQVLDQQLTVVHAAPDCVSRQSFRGVLDDQSTGVFNGGIDVRRGADGTDAAQSNHNLLLSNQAEVNTQPRLEILADEVACTHGATVGQLDDTAMYYLRSRGIGADEARRLLINGFADQIVDEVRNPEVRAWISHRLGHDDHE